MVRIVALLLGFILFINLYYQHALDRTLHALQVASSIVNNSSTSPEATQALPLIDQLLVQQAVQEKPSLKTILPLLYVQGVLERGSSQRSLEDVQTSLNSLTDEFSEQRFALLAGFDRMISSLYVVFWNPSLLWTHSEKPDAAQKIVQSAESYRKSGSSELALALYLSALRESPSYRDAHVATLLIEEMEPVDSLEKRSNRLEKRLSLLPPGPEAQRLGYQLGNLLMKIYKTRQASNVFHQAFRSHPEGRYASLCLLKEIWCLRSIGQFDDALDEAQEFFAREPQGPWTFAVGYQMADMYKASGDIKSAILLYEWLLSVSKDDSFSATLLFQIGAIYLFDLKDRSRAFAYFQQLTAPQFSASPFPTVVKRLLLREFEKSNQKQPVPSTRAAERKMSPPSVPPPQKEMTVEEAWAILSPVAFQTVIDPVVSTGLVLLSSQSAQAEDKVRLRPIREQEVPKKESAISGLSAQGESLLSSSLENLLLLSVESFSKQLERFMDIVNEKELTRRYTEEELRVYLLNGIQERFPGQLSEVDVAIHPEGFFGSGKVHLGPMVLPIETQVGIAAVNDRPHVHIFKINVGVFAVPEDFQKKIETSVNEKIDGQRSSLKVKRFELREGYALISVERKG